ncbi:hypothetical protein M3N64_09760 [Sporolactobacillus sp. CPB3-1]|uniref:Uncharacterized protein n=1 Tax=Sporolactobacillus mangiferae TaxID=2940498 RepID=A0ABT0MBI2_9BACL|nr:hypothetical protein [Sporolactobacillus mangiferae]MCL1632225.1 hypothetical protein [Sporolactobacillus mangiferae]
MPFHQKVNNEARLTKMIDDLGISLNPGKTKENKKKKDQSTKKEDGQENK